MSQVLSMTKPETKSETKSETKPEKRTDVKRHRQYHGLCLTCNNAPTCTYRQEFGEPKLFCEEFEGYATPPVRTGGKDISLPTQSRAKAEEKGSGKYKGLCSNCENRETCTFPKPEEGVWRCEEYR